MLGTEPNRTQQVEEIARRADERKARPTEEKLYPDGLPSHSALISLIHWVAENENLPGQREDVLGFSARLLRLEGDKGPEAALAALTRGAPIPLSVLEGGDPEDVAIEFARERINALTR